MKNLLLLFVLTAFCSVFVSTLEAQTNPKISVQGTLKDANSITVADGTYPITFKLYHELTGGTAVWEETADVAVSGGIYSYNIGTTEVLNPAVFEQPVFLGINVNGIELSPRGEMTFAPYALAVEYAATAGTIVGGIDMTNLTQDISTTQNIHADGNITVGTNNLNATAGEESLRIVRGAIEHNYSDPTNPTIIAGAGFTVSYCSTGCPNANPGNWTRTYLITFDVPFSAPPIVTANITRNNGLYPVIVHTSVNSVDITLLNTNDAVTNGDGNFQFIVVGPR